MTVSDDDNRGFGYQPALDGVRAVAVGMVLVFHAGFSWMTGGYVGVSVFFTLSGYLITSLALVEHDRRAGGGLDVGAFYSRRIRRLLPASLVCITGVMLAAGLGQFHGITNLRRDIWAALAQVYNWTALAGRGSYADQMARAAGQRAPLDHYWSLAIEEQFYWVWPLVLVVLVRLSGKRRVVAVGVLTLAFSAVAVAVAVMFGGDAAYFATPARLPEILVGALVAVALHASPRTTTGPHRPIAGLLLTGASLGAIVFAAVVWPARGGPATSGWLPALAVASGGLVVGLQFASPVRRVLGAAPLVAVGRISYGVYLYHWPIYTLVDERRLDVGRVPLFAVRLGITLLVAVASYRLVERPIRRWTIPRRPLFVGAVAVCVSVALFVAMVPDRPGNYTYLAGETRAAAAIRPSVPGVPLAPLPGRPLRVLVAGDSTAYATAEGLIQWAAEHPDRAMVTSMAAVGCGLNPTGELPDDDDGERCNTIRAAIPARVRRLRPDVVVAMVTFRDMADREWSPGEGLLTPTDARFRR